MAVLNHWRTGKKQVFIIKLPEWENVGKGNIVQKNSFGEVAPEEWHSYLALQKTVSEIFIKSCASHWHELQKENASLRAVLNGQLVSVSEKFYDDFILNEIAQEGEKFHEAVVIGRIISKYQLGISDTLVASRIDTMVSSGKFEVVTVDDDMPYYHRHLRKCVK